MADLKEAQSIVLALCLIVTLGAIGLFIADTTITSTALTSANVSATGTLTLSNDSTDAENVTISDLVFEIDNDATNTSGNIAVNVVDLTDELEVVGALATAINNNATAAALVTATNTTTTVLLTSDLVGTLGNAITTTENMANASWGAATLTGGLDQSQFATMQLNILGAGQTGASFIVILVIAFVGSIAIGYMFGMLGRKR